MTQTGRARAQARPSRLAALALVALLAGACGSAPVTSPTGSVSSSPAGTPAPAGSPSSSGTEASVAPSPSAASSPTPSAKPSLALQANIAVRVTVSSLNVREWPSTGAKKMGSLAKGDILVLLGYGGIKAGGYTWFEAARIKGLHGPLPALPADPFIGGEWTDMTGWIAVGIGSTAYVASLAPRCAASPDLATLAAMLPGEQLACLGSRPLVLEGTFGCGGCGGAFPGTFTPEWLATPLSGPFSVDPTKRVGPVQLYFPPGMTRPDEGQILRVHGHLADARSSTCKISIPTSDSMTATLVPIRTADARAWCAQHLVVDSFDVLGVNPSWPPG